MVILKARDRDHERLRNSILGVLKPNSMYSGHVCVHMNVCACVRVCESACACVYLLLL